MNHEQPRREGAANRDPYPPLLVARFDTAMPGGKPAFGDSMQTDWSAFVDLLRNRRVGPKDGPNFVPARFKAERGGRVRRLKQNLIARTAIALDCETDKKTGEVPPDVAEVVGRLTATGWAAVVYTSHNHTAAAPRYRIVLPLSAEMPPDLPAVEVIAKSLGLDGVLDRSKLGAASLFYLPSSDPDRQDEHQTETVEGAPIAADWMQKQAQAILDQREAEQAAIRAAALKAAEERLAARIAAGLKPAEKLIADIRDRLDMAGELLKHGYKRAGNRYLYAGSETGIPGVHVLTGSDGICRVYSHHGGDPLAAANLPGWCTVKAIDVVDLVTILDFGGDRKKALHELGKRFQIGTQSKQRRRKQQSEKEADQGGDLKTNESQKTEPPAPSAETNTADFTEDGIALAFAAEIKNKCMFDHTAQSWFIWDGSRWKQDIRAGMLTMTRNFVRNIRENAERPGQLGKIAFISAVAKAAAADPRIAASQDVWDTQPMMLGVPGGTVDLRSGQLHQSAPRNYISRQTSVAPAPMGTAAPLWQSFLDDLTKKDRDTQKFLQRLCGYILTGDTTEEVLTFLYGQGGNGKGVLVNVVTSILHEYSVAVPIEVFTAGSRINLEYYRAQMAGARLVVASETEAGATWAESQIKEMTGAEAPLSARHPHGRPFTFRPQFKIILVGNYAPKLKGRSAAMERRLRVIPCTHTPPTPDPELKNKLRAEYPAILRWMIDGTLAWRKARLGTAAQIVAATGAYFEQQDAFRRWIEERCILDSSLSLPPGKLMADFTAWARAEGEEPISSREFAELVDRRPGLRRTKSNGVRLVQGIGLIAPPKRGDGQGRDGRDGRDGQ